MTTAGSYPVQPPPGPPQPPPGHIGPQPGDRDGTGGAAGPGERLAASARGWQRIQLAVLGFIGFCGVLWASGDTAVPAGGQWVVAGLVVLSLALACLAIFLVGRVAHPLSAMPDPQAAGRRLRAGIAITYVALVMLVVATLSAWWPGAGGTESVEVRDVTGRTWCGELVAGPAGGIRLDTADGQITIPVNTVAALRPVTTC